MSDDPTEPAVHPKAVSHTLHRRQDWRAAAVIGVLTLLLGFAIAIQFHSTSSGDALAGERPDDLISILDDQNSESARLRARITALQGTLQRLRDAGTNGPAARQEAQAQADGLGILTGTVAATGPGVSVTITDPESGLKAEDLLDVVEELRGAGAEAIQFGRVRVSTDTSFGGQPGALQVDGTAVLPPYRVLAIGPAKTMDTALSIPGGASAVIRSEGGDVHVTEQARVSVTATRAPPSERYEHTGG